jgi:NAD(P)-dependent dehydrogenase (short-subunit alcohol dehydrogenase family)
MLCDKSRSTSDNNREYAAGRVGQPENIARVALFLASNDAGWLTGEIIHANGGNM